MYLNAAVKAGINVLGNMVGVHKPIMAQYEITYECNLKCEMCNVWRTKGVKQPEIEDIFILLKQLKDAGIVFLNITGGEPFLYPKLKHVLRRAKKHGMHTSVNTNGTLLKGTISGFKGFIDMMHISLDSPFREEHEAIRGVAGCYDKTVAGIYEAQDYVRTAVNMTVTAKNFNRMEDMARLTAEWDTELFMTPVSIIPTESRDVSAANNLLVKSADYVNRMIELKGKYPHIKTSDAYLNFVDAGGFDSMKCKADTMMVNIKPDGMFASPCGYFPVKRHGSMAGAREGKSGTYSFCKGCTLSCFFLPSAVAELDKLPSIMQGYW